MPNHYGNTLICTTTEAWYDDNDDDTPHEATVRKAVTEGRLCALAVPQPPEVVASAAGADRDPNPLWYRWNLANWGTKWGDYSGKWETMAADHSPPLITFNTAWGPPNEGCRAAIRAWLAERGVAVRLWVGSDPYDDSTKVIEDWTP